MKDLLEILLDANNKEPIVLTDDNGINITFEQVAIIPYEVGDDERLYAVLKPLDKIDGIEDDEAMVFKVSKNSDGSTFLNLENDELIAIEVFNQYYDLLENARSGADKETNKKRKGDKK